MKYNVVYRKNNQGIWQAVAVFLIHSDGTDYAERMNLLEPGRYQEHLENLEMSIK